MRELLSGVARWPVDRAREAVDDLRRVPRWRVVSEIGLIALVVGVDVASAGVLTGLTGGQLAGLAAVLVALLLLRWLLPSVTLVVGLPLAYPWDLSTAAVLVLVFWAGYRIAGWQRSAAALIVAVAVSMALSGDLHAVLRSPVAGAQQVVFVCMGLLLPFLIGRYAAQRAQLARALAWQERQVRRERALLTVQARLRERNRIAQDMHDGLGHRLSLISVLSATMELNTGLPAEVRDTVQALHTTAHDAAAELREIIGTLAPDAASADERGPHTVEAIPALVAGVRATGVPVELRSAGPVVDLPAAVSHAAYRVVQEGLTNAHKHAAGAEITVSVVHEPDGLLVEVRNGPSVNTADRAAPGTRLGLVGLAERVRLAGGVLHSGAAPDGGFRVAATLPYQATDSPVSTEDDPAGPDPEAELGADPAPRGTARAHAGTGALIAAGVCAVGVVSLFFWMVGTGYGATVSRSVYDAVWVGQSEPEVLAVLPEPSEPALLDIRSGQPPVPPHAVCRYYLADQQPLNGPDFTVVRFCFADNALVSKDSYSS
ncbi:histidine kinase [Kutzneria viridogrisea]|uniref:histidine kinase n=2 Tax=Kutzneria TaxID=43356 RepID=W5WC30_9PSEU|nr:histidine kinase [Kutzneria albida]AHH98713.1 hypothetical protein KALB_5351 [Kutzneria albida DSM 43870]MBA8923774.1 signal transduction histidine kinase [Kutzneria viridogrisea]